MEADQTQISIYGTSVLVSSSNNEIHRWLRFDFSYFIEDSPQANPCWKLRQDLSACGNMKHQSASSVDLSPFISIKVHSEPAPENLIPPLVESMHSPEYVCYDDGPVRYVDYYGRAYVVFDYSRENARMYSLDTAFLYEKLYLLILARVGEKMDRQGIHRVHALAVSYREKATLFLMPTRGGKSTLALSLLEEPDFKLLSEDTPLVNHQGQVLPFPLKLALSRKQIPQEVPAELLREFPRDKWGTKVLLHLDYFKSKIELSKKEIGFLMVGKWLHDKNPKIEPISRLSAFATLLRDCVFGLGLPQIVEYFLRSNKKDLFNKGFIAFWRIYACLILVFKAPAYRLLLSPDINANKKMLKEFYAGKLCK